jgi:glucose-1-phosphate thymidylyltransferase
MHVIMPVAGLGTRLRPQTWSRPKPLVTVAGKTLIDHVLDRLAVLDIDRVVFVTGYLGDQIEKHIRANYDFDAVFVVQEEQLGQSHAILQARDAVSGPAVVLFPDMIFEADLKAAERTQADGLLWVMPVDDPSRFGVVVKDGELVTRLVEKPDKPISDLAIMGVYYFKEIGRLLEAIDAQIAGESRTKGEYFLADAIQLMIDRGAVFQTAEATVWQDAGTNQALLETNRYLLDRSSGDAEADMCVIIPPVLIDPSAVVERSIIGPYTSIGPDARVVGSIVSDSIIDIGAHIESANLTSSIIGRYSSIRGRRERVNVGDSSELGWARPGDNV